MNINTTHNKRFAVMRGVCPQKVLSDFQAFTPARTFVNPALRIAETVELKQVIEAENKTVKFSIWVIGGLTLLLSILAVLKLWI